MTLPPARSGPASSLLHVSARDWKRTRVIAVHTPLQTEARNRLLLAAARAAIPVPNYTAQDATCRSAQGTEQRSDNKQQRRWFLFAVSTYSVHSAGASTGFNKLPFSTFPEPEQMYML